MLRADEQNRDETSGGCVCMRENNLVAGMPGYTRRNKIKQNNKKGILGTRAMNVFYVIKISI